MSPPQSRPTYGALCAVCLTCGLEQHPGTGEGVEDPCPHCGHSRARHQMPTNRDVRA